MSGIALLLWFLVSAGIVECSTDCVDATLPNPINLEECLGTSLDICEGTEQEVVEAVVTVVECVASRLVDISPIGALAALIDLVGLVVGSLGVLGSELDSVTNILTPLCAVVDVPGCISMLSGSDTCYRPIPVSLPGYLDIGGCLDNAVDVCEAGEVATDEALMKLVNAIVCLVGELMDADAGSEIATALSCTVVTLVESAASSGGLLTQATLGTLTSVIGTTITC
ncbi:uncharacterized protein LOC119399613 [Rhipicephalus sanguineus]|uniref:uncharacterized protein LOC119399613 n=1 Tax=Rhipicephalus sanguineus TaxID=34632 RepID=UPI0018957A61|nr:uncharacterized protein LOC119399613 [Rhipicephalus sanguineus]